MENVKPLLILGNGISRIEHKDLIRSWEGPVWGCNRAIYEYKDIPNLSLMTCDASFIKELMQFREENKLQDKIRVIHKKIYRHDLKREYPDIEYFYPEKLYIGDSGTNLVALALEQGYQEIYVCGFDLGGKDIYVKGHEKRSKPTWVERWRRIYRRYGLERINFIGVDHKPFIKSNLPVATYAKMYTKGENHLEADFGVSLAKKHNRVLILGNGKSRLHSYAFIKAWYGEVWVCNGAFIEYETLPRMDVVASVHLHTLREAKNFFETHSDYRPIPRFITSKQPIKNMEDPNDMFYEYFVDRRGWSTGNLLIEQALYDGYEQIVLAGFDMGGPDIYNPPRPGSQFRKQFITIVQENDTKPLYFLNNNSLTPLSNTEWNNYIKEEGMGSSILSAGLDRRVTKRDPFDTSKKIIVIGNGPSVKESFLGNYIDSSFDYVIRLNDFVTEGYEINVGTKTTHWISGASQKTAIKGRPIEGFLPMLYLPEGWWKNRGTIRQRVQKNTGIGFNTFFTVPLDQILKTKKVFSSFSDIEPSTGMFALIYLIEIIGYDQVYTLGFDFYQTGCSHYFGESDRKSTTAHDWDMEKTLYEMYKAQGKIVELNPKVQEISESKVALVSMIDDGFIDAFRVFAYSLQKSNPWFNFPIILLDNGVSDSGREACLKVYPNIIFRKIDRKAYEGIAFESTGATLRDTYYKLEMFKIENYDRIVFLDLDTIVLGDIKQLFFSKADIAGVPIYRRNTDDLGAEINTGVLSIGKNLLNTKTFDDLVQVAKSGGFSLPDQKVINRYFHGQFHVLPKKYNVEKRIIESMHFPINVNDPSSVTILHYVNEKPWYSNLKEKSIYDDLYQIWRDYLAEINSQEELV